MRNHFGFSDLPWLINVADSSGAIHLRYQPFISNASRPVAVPCATSLSSSARLQRNSGRDRNGQNTTGPVSPNQPAEEARSSGQETFLFGVGTRPDSPPGEIRLRCGTVTTISSLSFRDVISLSGGGGGGGGGGGQDTGRGGEPESPYLSPPSGTPHLINETIDSVINTCALSY